jgi:hypothetical protein
MTVEVIAMNQGPRNYNTATADQALSAIMALQSIPPAKGLQQPPLGKSQMAGNDVDQSAAGRKKNNNTKSRRTRQNHPFHCRNVRLNAKICQISDKGNLWELLDLVETCHLEMNIVNLSTIVHRAARLAKKGNTVRALSGHPQLARIRTRVHSELQMHERGEATIVSIPGQSDKEQDSLPRCLATIAWSYATLQVYDAVSFQLMANVAIPILETFKVFELTNLLWAFAKVQVRASRLFQAAMLHISSEASNLTPVSLSMVTWAYVQAYPQVPATLLKTMAHAFVEMLQYAKSQEISNMCWALATAKLTKPQVFERLGNEAATKLRSFNIQELSNTCWAFSRAGQVHSSLFSAVADLFVEKPALAFNFHGQALANMMWALAKQVALRGGNTSQFQSIAVCLMPACCEALDYFKPQEFSSVLWSVAKLGFRQGNNGDADRIFAAAGLMEVARLNCLSVQGLTNILYAFTEYTETSPMYCEFLGQLANCIAGRLDEFEVIGLLYVVESAHVLLSRGMPVRDLQKLAFLVALQVLKNDLTPASLSRLVAAAGHLTPEMRKALANIILQQQQSCAGQQPEDIAKAVGLANEVAGESIPLHNSDRQEAMQTPWQGNTGPSYGQPTVENSFGQEAIFKKGGRIDREANMNGKANPHRNNGSDPHNWAEAFSMPQRRNGYGKAQAPPAGFQPPRQMESSMQAVPVMQMGQQGTRDEPMWVQLPTKEAQQDANMMMPRPQQHRNVAQPADTMHGIGMAAPTFPIYRNNQNMPHGQQADIGAQNAQKEAEMMARLVFGGCGSQGEEQSDYFDNMHGMENADPDEGEDNGYGTSWMNLERIQTDESLCFHIRHNYEQEHHDTDSEVENIRGPIDFNMRMAPQDFAAAPHMHGQRVHAGSDQMLGPSLHGTRAHVQSQGVRAVDAPHPSHQTTSPSMPRRRGLKPAPLKLDRFQTPNHAQSGFCPPSGIAETEEEHRQSFVSEDMTAGRSCHDTEEGNQAIQASDEEMKIGIRALPIATSPAS